MSCRPNQNCTNPAADIDRSLCRGSRTFLRRFRRFWWTIVVQLPTLAEAALILESGSVQNFRSLRIGGVDSTKFYRAAALDNLSPEDAKALLDAKARVIDLRNTDEIERKRPTRTDAAVDFYQELLDHTLWEHVPILEDVDSFWDEAIDRLPSADRFWGTVKTITTAGALDRAAARNLEQGGLSMLYTTILATSQDKLGRALKVCATSEEPVVFHCQKGKDRTGLLAMLLQSTLGSTTAEIVGEYAKSGKLIGESGRHAGEERETGTFIDWSQFRGSPAEAMQETLKWVQEKHGTVENYLLRDVGLAEEYLVKLRSQ